MLTLLICICGVIVHSLCHEHKGKKEWDDADFEVAIIVGSVGIILLAVEIICAYRLNVCSTLDKKIELYKHENEEIEEQINEVVEEYLDYENACPVYYVLVL